MNLTYDNLMESNIFLNTLLNNLTSALFIVDRNIKIQTLNDSFAALFYKDEDKMINKFCGNAIACVFVEEERKNCGTTSNCQECKLRKSLLKVFDEKSTTYHGKITREFYINNKKILKHFLFSTKPITYKGEEMALIIIDDITKLEEQKETIKRISNIDYLTHLYNRRYFFDTGKKYFKSIKENKISAAAIMIDLDNFKKINDLYGHEMGDLVLKRVSRELKKNIRKTDIIARFGGEEFCLLLKNIDSKDAYLLGEKLRSSIEKLEFTRRNEHFKVTISLGITVKVPDTLIDMVNVADKLLHKAKNNGKNQVKVDL